MKKLSIILSSLLIITTLNAEMVKWYSIDINDNIYENEERRNQLKQHLTEILKKIEQIEVNEKVLELAMQYR